MTRQEAIDRLCDVYAGSFDVTRHELVTAIITERGVASPPFDQTLRALWERP